MKRIIFLFFIITNSGYTQSHSPASLIINNVVMDSNLFVIKSQLDSVIKDMLFLPIYYLDTLNTRIYDINFYQQKKTIIGDK
jgi:hypothetical protein